MKKNLIYLAISAVAAVALSSCGGGFKQGPGGLLYTIHEDKSGPTIKEGDFVSVNMIAKTDSGKELQNTYAANKPLATLMPKAQFKGDVVAGVMMLSEGDSATIKVNIDSMAKAGQPRSPDLKGKYITFQIKVEKVIAKGNLSDNAFQERIKSYFTGVVDALKKAEPGNIQKYITDNSLKTTKTASGLNYVITKPGSGPTPVAGDTVEVNYVGKYLNGKVFETNVKEEAMKDKSKFNPMMQYKPIRFPVGVKQVIPGWDEGLMLMNKGAKATLVIPAMLAYGEQGMGPIGPYSSLVFEVELVNIKKPDPNAPKPAAPMMMPPPAPTKK